MTIPSTPGKVDPGLASHTGKGANVTESKKTFGEYICKRRKELGMTQREFAGQLYVTESAVSKWERGDSFT